MAMKVRYNVVDNEIVSEQRSSVKSFYVSDAIGSTIAITDSSGTVTDQVDYWPYGSTKTKTGSSGSPFLYCGTLGYYTDISHTYIRARYLSRTLGRWITSDPIGFDGGEWNLYSYVAASPVLMSDPTGLHKNYNQCINEQQVHCDSYRSGCKAIKNDYRAQAACNLAALAYCNKLMADCYKAYYPPKPQKPFVGPPVPPGLPRTGGSGTVPQTKPLPNENNDPPVIPNIDLNSKPTGPDCLAACLYAKQPWAWCWFWCALNEIPTITPMLIRPTLFSP